ncbi:hypothetical protein Lgee_0549 [Legionella geestiana]|uniref:Putative auto-transporter adhesin head GIN domain-containing protein n=1 Tax=Legionella geestiana TaxID=45065 RepID=A0A0W0U540_9GAMM|nr:DUF2807 domain-containing protein [Legionella geestiana]KTD03198.1 hypothetical protein Lgee_0549 [Legionella geestiana]QBS12231.1 hypothetical protein E4T54_05435 [Legionella geestiana]QDQ40057.1 hypothetical protein E3226_006405 [Legionella geestiana]STX53036.1 Protein of uncharacterised function (DUF2807) [Legionella geestiana]
MMVGPFVEKAVRFANAFAQTILMLCLGGMLLLAAGCTPKRHASEAQALPQTAVQATQTRPMPQFTRVQVNGRLNVRLRTGFSKPSVILHGDVRDISAVVTQVQNGVLSVSLQGGYPRLGPVSVEIRANTLNVFDYTGVGSITGDAVHSNGLELHIANPGRTTLKGRMNLRVLEVGGGGYVSIDGATSIYLHAILHGKSRVQMNGVVGLARLKVDGEGMFGLYWVRSRHLVIEERDKAFVQLAGIADRVEIELFDRAEFAGRYLRAMRTYVRTHDMATARISSTNHQHTLALDKSNIYYYNIPATRADFMAHEGSVLDMREWSEYADKNWDIYNR